MMHFSDGFDISLAFLHVRTNLLKNRVKGLLLFPLTLLCLIIIYNVYLTQNGSVISPIEAQPDAT